MRLTPNLVALIVAQIRAGSFPSVAAEAAGVPREVFRRWLRRGRQRRRGRYARFRRQVRQAQAQARAKAEMDARNKDVKFWLRYGPGQAAPPWAAAKRPARSRDAAVAHQAELWRLLGDLTALLAPYPEARLALTQFLDVRPDSAGSAAL
ncbi:MAG: hypothetical protein JNM56_39155 [Planctomycetia bacterium]|nr:hypothetical protein [Planctomycetia bacterium]